MSKKLIEKALSEPKTINKVFALVYNYNRLRQAENLGKILLKRVAIAYFIEASH